MPTMISCWAWLCVAMSHPTMTTASITATPVALVVASGSASTVDHAEPILIAPLCGEGVGEPGWLLFESEIDEESDETNECGISTPGLIWPAARLPFGPVVSNPHLLILPRSAFRTPVLRC